MKLYRYDYENQDGKIVRVRNDEIYAWAVVNTTTGEVDLGEVCEFDDDLRELCPGWEWMRFNLTLSHPAASKSQEKLNHHC